MIEILKFYYGENYKNKIIEIPNDTKIIELESFKIRYKYKDTYSKDYLMLSMQPFNEDIQYCKILDWYIGLISSAIIPNFEFSNLSVLNKIPTFYFKTTCFDAPQISSNFKEILNAYNENYFAISKSLEWTPKGLKVGSIITHSWLSKKQKQNVLNIDVIDYDTFISKTDSTIGFQGNFYIIDNTLEVKFKQNIENLLKMINFNEC